MKVAKKLVKFNLVKRKAVVAGSWYPGTKDKLVKKLEQYFMDTKFGPTEMPQAPKQQSRSIIDKISPHAGYEYSGACAAHTYLNIFKETIPDTVIILGTDHQGYGKVALLEEGEWETPLGNLPIDSDLSKVLLNTSKTIIGDNSAFMGGEHNIEIQLPFIKYCAKDKDLKIITIKISPRVDFNVMEKISNDIAEVIKSTDKDIAIVASSDMSHKHVYSMDDLKVFKKIDQAVIDAFIQLEPKKALEAALKTSVCGPQTITSLILIGQKLNASKGELLKYYTSSEKTGNFGYCVGYFSGIIVI